MCGYGERALDVIEIVSTTSFTTTRPNTLRAGQNTSYLHQFHHLFTKKSADWRWRRIVRSVAEA